MHNESKAPVRTDFAYRSPDDLAQLTDDELTALFDSIPHDYADLLQQRYRAILKTKAITGDEQELQLIRQYQDRYKYEGLVPVAKGWVKVSPSKRQAFISEHDDAEEKDREPVSSGLPRSVMLGAFVLGAIFFILVLSRVLSRGNRPSAVALLTASPTVTATATHTPTTTPTPTATPIALVESDRFINSGEASGRIFPVFLQISMPNEPQPRVWVVQQKLIDTTEWQFDPNPDVASWLSGLLVRPVIGIPFSTSNSEFFASLSPQSRFKLRMNTGQELHFVFRERRQVGREDTSLFQQAEPGLVFVLIGEVDEFAMPTSTRQVIIADYLSDQEMQTFTLSSGMPAPIGQVVRIGDLDVEVTGVSMLEINEDASSPFAYGFVTLSISVSAESEQAAVSLAGYQWLLEDEEGMRYPPDVNAESVSRFAPLPAYIERGQTVSISLGFLVHRYISDARLLAAASGQDFQSFAIPFEGLPIPPSIDALDVQIRAIRRDTRAIYVEARFYNPQGEEVPLTPDDIWMIFGFVSQPTGARTASQEWSGLTLAPRQAYDTLLTFPWNGRDPYALLGIAGREFAITLLAE